ncbi:MAG: glycosyltransferase [Acidobacteria bacterium]|nr:glycosyltransferase [Acidobacteriota bacterium]
MHIPSAKSALRLLGISVGSAKVKCYDQFEGQQLMANEPCSAGGDRTIPPLKALMLIDGMESITAGGTERQFLQLAQIAKSCGVKPWIGILRKTEWLTEEIAGCPVQHFDLHTLKSITGLREMARVVSWIKAQRFDVLQTFFSDSNLFGPLLGRLSGIPVITGTRRCLSDPAQLPKPWSQLIYQFRNAMVDNVIANSMAVMQSVLDVERFSPSKLDVVYNGVDLQALRVARHQGHQVRSELHIGKEHLLVGNISGLRKVKGLPTFLKAASIAAKNDPKLRFVIVGEGDMRPMLEQMITSEGLEEVVSLVGAQHDVRPYLAAMDIAVLCSTAEGLSNSLLEYMAAGLPIIATDVGGNREVVGDVGILIPPEKPEDLASAILSLRSADRRREMGQNAYQNVGRFDIRIAEQRMADHFRRYAQNPKIRRRKKQEE